MSPTKGLPHTVVVTLVGIAGWGVLVVLAVATPVGMRPLELSWSFVAIFAMTTAARFLAVRVFEGVVIALDSAFYVSAAFIFGLLPASWMLLVILTADAVVRYLSGSGAVTRFEASWREAVVYLTSNGGVPAFGFFSLGLLYGIDARQPMSDADLAVIEPAFAVTFLLVHYAVVGIPHLFRGVPNVRLWGDYFVRVVLAEVFLIPLALAMVVGFAHRGPSLYLLLGANCLIFNVIFRRATISADHLRQRVAELSTLDKVGRIISGSLERRTLLANIATETLRLVRHTSRFMIGLVESKGDVVTYELFDESGRSYRKIGAPRDEGLSGWVMLHREPLLLGNLQRQYRLYSKTDTYNDPKFNSWLGVPLVIYDEVIGVMSVQSETPEAYTKSQLRVLTTIADQAAVALENSRLYELATIDGLTGLLVRRHFEQRLEEEWARATRYGSEFALGIFDLDDFKALNDTYGHQAGDQALRAAAAVVRRNMRSADIAGRYGGEEFAFILPRTSLREAVHVAERVRGDVERMRVKTGIDELRLTASIGLAAYPDPRVAQSADLVALADEAMYLAKRLGKNRVCMSTDLENQPAVDDGLARERGVV